MGNFVGGPAIVRKRVEFDGVTLMGHMIFCPACKSGHLFDMKRWTFNGDTEKPTFSPSMLSRVPGGYGDSGKDHVCHSFVRDGKIEYLSDCTHELAGKTVPLEPF